MTEKQLKEIQDRYEINETGVDTYAILGAHAKKDIPNLLFYIRVLEDNLNTAEADNTVLVEALNDCWSILVEMGEGHNYEAEQALAALASVKGVV